MFNTKTLPRRLAVLTLGCASLLPLAGIAQAQTASSPSTATQSGQNRPVLSATQEACLTAKGFTNPARPVDGTTVTPRTPPTAEQRAAFQAAATACGITLPSGGPAGQGGPGGRPQLTNDQQSCLATNGITPPAKPVGTAGTRPARVEPTAEQRAAFDAAATACGITLPIGR